MKKFLIASALLSFASLTACGGNGDDKLAERVEDTADQKAEMLDERADQLEEKADAVRETGEDRANAIDAADVDAEAMAPQTKAAIVEGEAPAVK